MLNIIDEKAEKIRVQKLDENKASREELSKTNHLIENLNERMKHLANVQHEFAGTL